jgi:hypothetical protein
MPFPVIWSLNYELQFGFKKGKTLEICHIFSEFDFFAPPPPPYKSTPDAIAGIYSIICDHKWFSRIKYNFTFNTQ